MYRNILVATDGSDLAARGVEQAVALAADLHARLVVLTASEPWHTGLGDPMAMGASAELLDDYRNGCKEAADEVLGAAAALAQSRDVSVETVYLPERPPADAILETASAQGCDLIVMASHGRSGLGRLLLGSQTQAVLTRSTLPVLVVR